MTDLILPEGAKAPSLIPPASQPRYRLEFVVEDEPPTAESNGNASIRQALYRMVSDEGKDLWVLVTPEEEIHSTACVTLGGVLLGALKQFDEFRAEQKKQQKREGKKIALADKIPAMRSRPKRRRRGKD